MTPMGSAASGGTAPGDPAPAANPFVGPRAFRLREKNFFGRERETAEIVDLVTSERLLVLHAPSGAGKTSLIQAALIPALEADFTILPVIRVGRPVAATKGINRYLLSTLISLAGSSQFKTALSIEELASFTLAKYLAHQLPPPHEEKPELLIFDQFEEVLTLDPCDQPAKAEFFAALGELLRRDRRQTGAPVRWVLFALREEFLAALQPYFKRLPTPPEETYRLDLLGPDAALRAIREPALQSGFEFPADAAQALVDNLRHVKSAGAPPGESATLGNFVEPVHLQVVCRQMLDRLAAKGNRGVSVEDVEKLADVDNALGGYYADSVRTAAAQVPGFSETVLRSWIADRLVTTQGLRAMFQTGSEADLPREVVSALLEAFLIRKDERNGFVWIELSHDRMVEPLRRDNERWFAEHLHPMQFQATQWQNRTGTCKTSLLLRGPALADARRWAANNPACLRAVDNEFLDACTNAATTVDRVGMTIYRWWAFISTGVVLLLLSLAGVTCVSYWEADGLQKEALKNACTLEKTNATLLSQQKELQQSLDNQVDLYRQQITALSIQATKLIEAKDYESALRASLAWQQLFSMLQPKSGNGEIAKEFENLHTQWKKRFPDLEDRQSLTLHLAQKLGEPLKKATSKDKRYVLEKLREQVYADAVATARKLSVIELKSKEGRQLEEHFWHLYFGEMAVVESSLVESAMVAFGRVLSGKRQGRLADLAEALNAECEASLREGKPALGDQSD